MKALKQASGFIRHEWRERVDIRHIPELEFVYDESIEYGKKIENIIEKIKEEDGE
jgi:ribosome-binding factor A